MANPILLKIIRKKGETLHGAQIEYSAPRIDGFLAVVNPNLANSTEYIAFDNIASFTLLNRESCNVRIAFDRRLKVKVDESL